MTLSTSLTRVAPLESTVRSLTAEDLQFAIERRQGKKFLGQIDGHPAIIDPVNGQPTAIFPNTQRWWAKCIALAVELREAAEAGDAP